MGRKATISACLVVRNEEAVIQRSLESIKNVVDEIVVVHDGKCTDKTLKIASDYTQRIFVRPFIGEAEPHRVFAFQKTTGDWILSLDADEFLSEELRKKIKRLTKNNNIDEYVFSWPLWDGKRYLTKIFPWKYALARKKGAYYLGLPHQHLFTYGTMKYLPLRIEHRPKEYNWAWKVFKSKYLPWAKIQAGYLVKNFDEIPKFQVKEKDWSLYYKMKRAFPLTAAPFSFIEWIGGSIRLGAWKEGPAAWKFAFLWALYQVFLWYYVWRLKVAGLRARK